MWKHILTHFYLLILLRYISCCQCNFNNNSQNIEKRQLDAEDYSSTGVSEKTTDVPEISISAIDISTITIIEDPQSTTEGPEAVTETTESRKDFETTTEANKTQIPTEQQRVLDNLFDLNENSSEIIEALVEDSSYDPTYLSASNETTDVRTERPSNSILVKKCRHYKNGNYFNLTKMADVWQVVYYRLSNKLKCFKLNIKLVTATEQQRYAKVFGNFNDTVHWNHCFLEITSTEKEHSGRRHFLQGTEKEKGVMENVIIDEEYWQNTTYLTLHRESGDQWLVIDNLLVMRDCENADFVVFGREQSKPRKEDVMDALAFFGEFKPNGTIACTDSTEKSLLKLDDNSSL